MITDIKSFTDKANPTKAISHTKELLYVYT